jgi:aryl-alcohol dehydrogenase-like predicted oxidoreductase
MVLGDDREAKLQRVRRFTALARDSGEAPAQLALAWCLRNRHVSSVILGATTPAQLRENLGALEVAARLDQALVGRIEAAVA